MRRLALALFLFGCGSNDSITPTQARTDCEAYLSISCGKLVPCFNGLTQADCVAMLRTVLDCAKVNGENGELAVCEKDIGNSTCAALVDSSGGAHSPASCKGVFTLP